MAGALGLALAGPRVYGGVAVDDASMGDGRRERRRRRHPRARSRSIAAPMRMLIALLARACAALLIALA